MQGVAVVAAVAVASSVAVASGVAAAVVSQHCPPAARNGQLIVAIEHKTGSHRLRVGSLQEPALTQLLRNAVPRLARLHGVQPIALLSPRVLVGVGASVGIKVGVEVGVAEGDGEGDGEGEGEGMAASAPTPEMTSSSPTISQPLARTDSDWRRRLADGKAVLRDTLVHESPGCTT